MRQQAVVRIEVIHIIRRDDLVIGEHRRRHRLARQKIERQPDQPVSVLLREVTPPTRSAGCPATAIPRALRAPHSARRSRSRSRVRPPETPAMRPARSNRWPLPPARASPSFPADACAPVRATSETARRHRCDTVRTCSGNPDHFVDPGRAFRASAPSAATRRAAISISRISSGFAVPVPLGPPPQIVAAPAVPPGSCWRRSRSRPDAECRSR